MGWKGHMHLTAILKCVGERPVVILITQTQKTQPVSQLGLKQADKGNISHVMHSEASELAAKAAAKSTGVPWFKGDQAKRLSCQNQSRRVIKMAPKTSLAALGNGEAKPFRGRGSLCLAEADTLAAVLSSPVGSSRLGESCSEQGQQATATAKGMGSLGSRQEETASPQKSFRAHPSLCYPLAELSHCPLLAL